MSDAATRNTPTDEILAFPEEHPSVEPSTPPPDDDDVPTDSLPTREPQIGIARGRSVLLGDTVIDAGALCELPAGTVLGGRFTILRRASRLELGSLYDARADDGRRCSLKVIEPSDGLGAAGDRRLLHEARTLSMVQSAYVPSMLGAGRDEDLNLVWMATSTIDGPTLADRLTALGVGGVLNESEVWGVLDRVAEGLADLHRAGVVHCDLKPSNVLLTNAHPSGVMILDLSSSVAIGARASQDGVGGTPLWMAPEQARGEALTPATDVWSFGVLAFRLLTGRSYWRVAQAPISNVRVFLREMMQEPLATARERAESLRCARQPDEAFDAWFSRCVARTPARRFRDADEMRTVMRALNAPNERARTLPPPRRSTPPRPPRSAPPPQPRPSLVAEAAPRSRRPPPPAEPLGPDSTQVRTRAKNAPPRPREQQLSPSPFDVSPFAPPTDATPSSPPPGASLAAPTDATLPLSYPPVGVLPGRRVASHALIAIGACALALTAIFAMRPSRREVSARATPTVSAPSQPHASAPTATPAPPPVATPLATSAWPLDARRIWSGRSMGEEGAWTFQLSLRRTALAAVIGHFAWTNAQGVQVRESVSGEWGATPRELVLRGEMSSSPGARAVNAYRVNLREDGAITGATLDRRDSFAGSPFALAAPRPMASATPWRPAAPAAPRVAATPVAR